MIRFTSATIAIAALALTIYTPIAPAQTPAPGATFSQEDAVRIQKEIQKKLLGLTSYGVFDWLTFGIHGKTVTLHGYASRPILKSDAERAVKNIKGIDNVDNQIEVLPLSPNDDSIRAAVYNRIYTAPSLRVYNANAGSVGRGLSPERMAGGITNDPPLGFHAIHIIVQNGHVTLFGVVNSKSDSDVAGMQANSAPGAFGVTNDLIVQGAPPKGSE